MESCASILLEGVTGGEERELRIEHLENKTDAKSPRPQAVVVTDSNGNDDDRTKKDEQVEIRDSVSTDPKTGLKKRTIVTERVLTTKTFHALSLDPAPSMAPVSNGRILSPGYQARVVHIDAKQLNQIEVETISGQLVVTRVNASANHDIHPGDTITHVNGKAALHQSAISGLSGRITLTLVPAAIHGAPSVFYRVNSDYNSDADDTRICRWLSIDVKKGDVVQIMSQDDNWLQARKVNDLSRVGYLPASLSKEKVAMLCPFGRRVLVLLGAVGVGRRTLKSMLLRAAPQYFATVVPMTSRAARPGEQEGREYHFVTKEEMLKKIRNGGMIEWGELDNQLYGTDADAVRDVVRSGRMCVLDCAPQALSHLYNSEFMPFVVHIVPPQLEEFLQLENLRQNKRPVDQLSKVCAESDQIANGPHADQIHLTLMNRNMDVTFKRLTDALELLRNDTQWVPESWMS
ncbi:unnamed protein product [Cylicocyclus nassatus]|uniref:Uncharacterized protein n=1 Tax=Cylicocyclus nassatus TaxID=53992 RepID=A0AA36DTC8_CYLNA|nr:unnamed protein product [Cylicocyclus nassatus]